MALLRRTLPAGIDLVTSFAGETPTVRADPTQIHQVVMNLCTNAWQAIEGDIGRIASPSEGTAFARPEAVLLLGRGIDLEDGEPRGEVLVLWRSDRDGVLGTGNHVVTHSLSRDRHILTLTATDSDGGAATTSVAINMVPPAPLPSAPATAASTVQ